MGAADDVVGVEHGAAGQQQGRQGQSENADGGSFYRGFLRQQGLTNSTVHGVSSRVGAIAGAYTGNVKRHLARCLEQKCLEKRASTGLLDFNFYRRHQTWFAWR